MRSWRDSAMLGVVLLLAAVASAFRAGQLLERDATDTIDPARIMADARRAAHERACDGERLSYREDDYYIRTYAGDPGDGIVCAVVPRALLFRE